MKKENRALIVSAMKLTASGIKLEAAREHLRKLTEDGVSYNSDRMLSALRRFQELDADWKELERQHLELRDKTGG